VYGCALCGVMLCFGLLLQEPRHPMLLQLPAENTHANPQECHFARGFQAYPPAQPPHPNVTPPHITHLLHKPHPKPTSCNVTPPARRSPYHFLHPLLLTPAVHPLPLSPLPTPTQLLTLTLSPPPAMSLPPPKPQLLATTPHKLCCSCPLLPPLHPPPLAHTQALTLTMSPPTAAVWSGPQE
jgi:hypothetical protein